MELSGLCAALVAGLLTAPAPPADSPAAPEPRTPLRLAAEPGGVAAVDVPLDSRFEPAGDRYHTSRMPAARFSMVGFTWDGRREARLRVRVRSDGTWGGWQRTERIPGASGSELLWVGRSDAVQVESIDRPVRGLAMTLIDPRHVSLPAKAPAARPDGKPKKPKRAPRPEMHSRKAWGADERLRERPPRYNRTIQQVHVHHTVNGNDYKRRDVPGLIRGMYRYHTQNLGWSDIGYNFLVDKFGRIWVGRAGGPGKPVRGAHTLGFNQTSTGIAVIGNYETAWPWKKTRTAIVHLAAWKLDKYGRNPAGRVRVYSHGSDRFPAGRMVTLPTMDGHRDTNQTACPGKHLYQKLPALRKRTAKRVARFS